jgi:hypothetical protein
MDDIPSPRNYNVLWMALAVVAVAVMVLIAVRVPKEASCQPSGFLRVPKQGFINVSTALFPRSAARRLRLEATGVDVWSKVFTDAQKMHFLLTTAHEGIVYTFKEGKPGFGAVWGTAFIAPLTSELPDMLFEDRKGIQPVSNVWSPNDNLLGLALDDEHQLLWNAVDQLGSLELAQKNR